jgi:hypothetical protein
MRRTPFVLPAIISAAVLVGYVPGFGQEVHELHGPGVFENLKLESFGVSSTLPDGGVGFADRLTDGPFTSHGFECARCIIRPASERSKYVLPPFGSKLTWTFARGRAQVFAMAGGINAWKPDNTTIDIDASGARGGKLRPGAGGLGRARSFNDAWQFQRTFGAQIAVDPSRHVWLGVAGHFIGNYGVGKRRWSTIGPTASFQFGH